MAVFMINICKYNDCGITFPRLTDLIEHIEDVHIDYDPAVVEQKEASQPACIPLSYVLKFFTEASRREFQSMPPAPVPDVRRRQISAPKTPSVRSCSTPTGSEMEDEDMLSPSEDSNDSWTTVDEYSSEYILRYGVKMNQNAANSTSAAALDKPFACPVPGCKKRYKNVNGIKYHSKNGHKKDGKVKKAYKCQCGKNYKTAAGLKSHSINQHIASQHPTPEPRAAPKTPGLVVTAAPARQLEGIDNKLVRIYDSIKTKDLPTFTIPKHNLSVSVVSARQAVPNNVRPKVSVHSTPAHNYLDHSHPH